MLGSERLIPLLLCSFRWMSLILQSVSFKYNFEYWILCFCIGGCSFPHWVLSLDSDMMVLGFATICPLESTRVILTSFTRQALAEYLTPVLRKGIKHTGGGTRKEFINIFLTKTKSGVSAREVSQERRECLFKWGVSFQMIKAQGRKNGLLCHDCIFLCVHNHEDKL